MQDIPNPFGDSPIIYLNNNDVVCNKGAKPAQLVAPARAGSQVTFKWDKWFDDHKGPVITYLASCGGDCRAANGSALNWFNIDEAGLYENASWATDRLMVQNNMTCTITLPQQIPNSQYLMRHKMIALHIARQQNEAEL
ncbi:Endoglucanase-4 [Drechslerella dactyloides]|uniref:lytic cellulose monooxygenase (C4-dehydrogenating) n=1 Tax=Drechslerella dactyloides TaxID=74499 RepID=A0AAD6NHB4_DREDA|nr:Endoglucanase-4 [Drechslerella dactyloides]